MVSGIKQTRHTRTKLNDLNKKGSWEISEKLGVLQGGLLGVHGGRVEWRDFKHSEPGLSIVFSRHSHPEPWRKSYSKNILEIFKGKQNSKVSENRVGWNKYTWTPLFHNNSSNNLWIISVMGQEFFFWGNKLIIKIYDWYEWKPS